MLDKEIDPQQPTTPITLTIATRIARTGKRTTIAIAPAQAVANQRHDPSLIKLIAKAFAARSAVEAEAEAHDPKDLARKLGQDKDYFARLVRLGYLAPDIISAILNGLDELRLELEEIEIALPEADLTLSGYSTPEIDTLRGAYQAGASNDLDDVPELATTVNAVSQLGDLFLLGDGKLICGDAQNPDVFAELIGGERAQLGFADPPYNVAIDGHVSGKGKHREFAMGSGEMTVEEFEAFLALTLGNAAEHFAAGALSYV
jgi:hypothetical protein